MTVIFEAPHRLERTLDDLAGAFGADHEIAVGRELTKVHEELVVGPISAAKVRFRQPRGEFTLLVPPKPDSQPGVIATPDVEQLKAELGHIAKSAGPKRRAALKLLAARYGLSVNELYKLLES